MNGKDTTEDPILKMDILVWRIIKLLIKSKKQTLDRFGLTSSQFDILSAIDHFSKIRTEIIQMDLSEKANIDPMTTSTILRNLEKKGLITRRRNTINTRTVLVELTREGTDTLKKATKQIRQISKKIYENVDEEWLKIQLMKISDKLNN